jgi:hypothetical protein
MKKNLLCCVVFTIILLFSGCSSEKAEKNTNYEDNSVSAIEVPEKVEQIYRRLDRWRDENPSHSNVKYIFGNKKDGDYWVISTHTLPTGFYERMPSDIKFRIREDGTTEKSFKITFPKDCDKNALHDFVEAMLYAVSNDIEYSECAQTRRELVASYTDGMSDIYESEEYKVFISETHIVGGYTVEAVHKEECNFPIDKSELSLFAQMEYEEMKSELNAGIRVKIKGKVSDFTLKNPYSTIEAEDTEGNNYHIEALLQYVMDGIVIENEYIFYCRIGKMQNYKDTLICYLEYFESVRN